MTRKSSDMVVSSKTWALLSMLVVGLFSRSFACPSSCDCKVSTRRRDNGWKLVVCYDKGLTSIPSGIPLDTNKLILTRNRISSLQQNAFQGLSNLWEIDISYNQLRNITDGVFSIKSLKNLFLQRNAIETISENAFTGSINLQKLSLAFNKITRLPENLFSGLVRLTHLYLNTNNLVDLPDGIFRDSTKLNTLFITQNKLTSISNELLKIQTNQQSLDFSYNNITTIGDSAFSAMSSTLNFLYLNNNNLVTFPKDAVKGLTQLNSLNLAYNKFQSLDVEVRDSLESLTKLSSLVIYGNPFVCRSALEWFQKWMEGQINVKNKDTIMCQTTEGISTPIVSFNFSALIDPTTATTSETTTATTTTTTTTAAVTTTTSETAATSIKTTPEHTTTITQAVTPSITPPIVAFPSTTPETTEQTVVTSAGGLTIEDSTILQRSTASTGSNSSVSRDVTTSPGGISREKQEERERDKLIIAVCVAASGIAIILCAFMYCFRKKIFMREKQEKKKNPLQYDRVAFAV